MEKKLPNQAAAVDAIEFYRDTYDVLYLVDVVDFLLGNIYTDANSIIDFIELLFKLSEAEKTVVKREVQREQFYSELNQNVRSETLSLLTHIGDTYHDRSKELDLTLSLSDIQTRVQSAVEEAMTDYRRLTNEERLKNDD